MPLCWLHYVHLIHWVFKTSFMLKNIINFRRIRVELCAHDVQEELRFWDFLWLLATCSMSHKVCCPSFRGTKPLINSHSSNIGRYNWMTPNIHLPLQNVPQMLHKTSLESWWKWFTMMLLKLDTISTSILQYSISNNNWIS